MPQVTEKIKDKWNAKNRYGDNRLISAESKISEHAIGRCIRTGRGAPETIEAVNKFYGIEKVTLVKNDIDNDN